MKYEQFIEEISNYPCYINLCRKINNHNYVTSLTLTYIGKNEEEESITFTASLNIESVLDGALAWLKDIHSRNLEERSNIGFFK